MNEGFGNYAKGTSISEKLTIAWACEVLYTSLSDDKRYIFNDEFIELKECWA